MLDEMMLKMDVVEWLKLNAELQQKKNAVRRDLKERGVLKREGVNNFDKYRYFSEAQYKVLFTELFAKHGLELKFDEIAYDMYEGSEKQANGRMPKVQYTLFDTATGFGETTTITGEGMDKGDKGGYKAYTGTLKYFLANTFLVATGDDPETDSPDAKIDKPQERTSTNGERKASSRQIETLAKYYTGDNLAKLLAANNIPALEDIPMKKASELIGKIMNKENKGDNING